LLAVVFVDVEGYASSDEFKNWNGDWKTNLLEDPETPGWEHIDKTWVPTVPVTAWWETKTGHSLLRTQLPLMLAWAITVHKIQGLTLEQTVIDLSFVDLALGLSFVAMSQVKTLWYFVHHFP
jgi:hypothetical protein